MYSQYNFGVWLRGICCLLIVNYHSSMLNVPYVYMFSKGGFILNVIFISLSGYFLSRFFDGGIVSWTHWFKRRLIKIYPSLFLVILLFTFLFLVLDVKVELDMWLLSFFGVGYWFNFNPFGIHLWFVSVILICYIAYPFVIRLIKISVFKYLSLLTFIVLLLFLQGKETSIYSLISSDPFYRLTYHFLVFFIGCWCGLFFKLISKTKIVIALLLLPFLLNYIGIDISIFLPISISGILLCFVEKKVPVIMGESVDRLINFLSNMSYEIYLVHYPILIIMVALGVTGTLFSYLALFLVTLLVAYLINILSTKINFKLS
jgi:peptidoglycan/LPS O-acetylase OafA/YrhL